MKTRLVDYSFSSSSDFSSSFSVENVEKLSNNNNNNTTIPIKVDLTPIPLKYHANRRCIETPLTMDIFNCTDDSEDNMENGQKIKKKQTTKPNKKHNSIICTTPIINNKVVKRWNKRESESLLTLLKYLCPLNDNDWELVAKKLNNTISLDDKKWNGEECQKQALKLKWKRPQIATTLQNAEKSQPDLKVVNGQLQKRSEEDFFANQSQESFGLDPDDSLLQLMKTPDVPAKIIRKPFLIPIVMDNTMATEVDEDSD